MSSMARRPRGTTTSRRHTVGFIGLVLNSSVFLNETMGKHQKALDIAQATDTECSASIRDVSDNSQSESTMPLELLRDNIRCLLKLFLRNMIGFY
jgi:hypothetical protein